MILLVPADPLAPRRADDHFGPEAAAAREAGHVVAVVDHDLLCAGEADEAVRLVPRQVPTVDVPGADVPVPAVYRGWMVTADQYAGFAAALGRRGVRLRTSPQQFKAAHEPPGWYAALRDHTPLSAWTVGPDLDALVACAATLPPGAAVLRDYVKSLKHSWAEAAYLPDRAAADSVRGIGARFLELRGDDLVGGLVVRAFEDFTTTEVRTWWVNGSCVLVTAHPDTPLDVPDGADISAIAPLVAALGLPFVTVDLALRADGVWRIVELGDGQVSDRPTSMSAADLLDAVLGTA